MNCCPLIWTGRLHSDERASLETRLQTDDGLRQELESLRQTVKLVGSLPAMKAPRNFTLTREMVGLRQNRWLIFPTSTTFSGITAAAATILILIGAGLFLLQNTWKQYGCTFDYAISAGWNKRRRRNWRS